MELKDQFIQEYLNTGCGYRKLQARIKLHNASNENIQPVTTISLLTSLQRADVLKNKFMVIFIACHHRRYNVLIKRCWLANP